MATFFKRTPSPQASSTAAQAALLTFLRHRQTTAPHRQPQQRNHSGSRIFTRKPSRPQRVFQVRQVKKTPVASSLFSGTPPFLRADDIFGSYLDDDEHYVGEYTSHREIDQGAILLARLTAGATISPARTLQPQQHNKPQREEACP